MRIVMTAGGIALSLEERSNFSVKIGQDWYGFYHHSDDSNEWVISVEMAKARAATEELKSRVSALPTWDESLTDFRKFVVNRVAGAE